MQMRHWPIAAATVLALSLAPPPAQAQFRQIPSELPFYARSVQGSGEWSPVIFYRPVSCIPSTFNLQAFFDPPRVFGCGPMTVDTFALWDEGPGQDPAPRHGRQRGLGAVPIWFVRMQDLLRARSDGVVTMPELESLSPLKGYASFFTETLHPEGAKVSVLIVNATGTLTDGRAFKLHITLKEAIGLRVVTVRFGD